MCILAIAGHRYRVNSAGIDISASSISIRYRSILVPDWIPLLRYRHRHIYSFRYRTDRMLYSPAFWHLKALYEDGDEMSCVCILAIAGHRHRVNSAGIDISASSISIWYRSILVPDWIPLFRYRHRHIYSFRYRTDRMPYSPAFWHLKALHEDGEGYTLLLLHCVMFNASAYCAFSSCAPCIGRGWWDGIGWW